MIFLFTYHVGTNEGRFKECYGKNFAVSHARFSFLQIMVPLKETTPPETFFENYSINKKVDCVPNSVCIALFYSAKTGQVLKLLRKWSFQVGMDMVERFGLGISGFFALV